MICVIDDYSRVAWAEVMEDITALTTVFAALRCMRMIREKFGIQFEEIIADNGPEFGPVVSQNKRNHPFGRMRMETGIKRRYIQPYRPQTNGKVERFWRTLKEDLIEETDFDSLAELEDELLQYLAYYNWERPHKVLTAKTDRYDNPKQTKITSYSVLELLNLYSNENCFIIIILVQTTSFTFVSKSSLFSLPLRIWLKYFSPDSLSNSN